MYGYGYDYNYDLYMLIFLFYWEKVFLKKKNLCQFVLSIIYGELMFLLNWQLFLSLAFVSCP